MSLSEVEGKDCNNIAYKKRTKQTNAQQNGRMILSFGSEFIYDKLLASRFFTYTVPDYLEI